MSNYYLSSPCPCGAKIQACDRPDHHYEYVCDSCGREFATYDNAIRAADRAEIERLRALCRETGVALGLLLDALMKHKLISPDGNYVALRGKLNSASKGKPHE